MERVKQIFHRLIEGKHPTWAALLTAASMFLAFGTPLGNTPLVYGFYSLSACSFFVAAAAAVVRIHAAALRLIHHQPVLQRYYSDVYFRVRVSLTVSFLINLCYAVLKLVYAISGVSFWDGALAFYYIMLSATRLYLIKKLPSGPAPSNYEKELRVYRLIGASMVVFNIALSGIAIQIIHNGHDYDYPGTLVFAAAAYTFYCLISSPVNAVKYRKFKSPVLSSAKALNLITALVSMFSLQTAMITRFGGSRQFRLIMTSITGAAVCVFALGIALYMVRSANKKLKHMKEMVT